jgi:hypothetical protein
MDDNSILNTVKKAVGVMPEYDVFDEVLIMHINSVFMVLAQMGVGPSKGFRIEDNIAEWTDFLSKEDENYESVKSYICMKVRLLFDPPSSSTHMECIKQLVSEFEWRLNFEAEESK